MAPAYFCRVSILCRDAFIAAAGCIPGKSATLTENALALARMAVEMQKLCESLSAPDGSDVVMRIGLHAGPVIGGIVGGNSEFVMWEFAVLCGGRGERQEFFFRLAN